MTTRELHAYAAAASGSPSAARSRHAPGERRRQTTGRTRSITPARSSASRSRPQAAEQPARPASKASTLTGSGTFGSWSRRLHGRHVPGDPRLRRDRVRRQRSAASRHDDSFKYLVFESSSRGSSGEEGHEAREISSTSCQHPAEQVYPYALTTLARVKDRFRFHDRLILIPSLRG